MRAILLVKDKEGLNAERLQNSRYGLTGKPTLTQQGVAGSLSSSFKASQEVTAVNLRSLTDKLREAQKALDGANNNIDRTDKEQDQMDEDKDKVNQLLSSGAWELLWTGAISPFKFYSIKYNEDVSNKAMAGEAGFPVQSIGDRNNNSLPYAPLPRFPYYDPIMKWQWTEVRDTNSFGQDLKNSLSLSIKNKGANAALKPFLPDDFFDKWDQAEKITQMGQSIKMYFQLLTLIDGITALIRILATAKRPSEAKKIIFHTALDTAILLICQQLIDLIDRVVNGNIYSFSGWNYTNADNSDLCFTYKTCLITVFANFYDNVQGTIRKVMNIIQYTYLSIHTATLATLVSGTIMSYIPWTAAIGEAMITGAMVVYSITSAAYYPAVIIPTIQTVQQIIDLSASRNLNSKSGSRILGEDNETLGSLQDYSSVLEFDGSSFENFFSKVITTLAEVKYWLNFVVPGIAIPPLDEVSLNLGVVNSYNCSGANYGFTWVLSGIELVQDNNYHDSNGFIGSLVEFNLSGKMTGIPLQSWWPIVSTTININDPVSEILDAEIYNPSNLLYKDYWNYPNNEYMYMYKSFVFEGDYFGRNHGIELVKETIYRTVFVMTKCLKQRPDGYTDRVVFYSCAALAATSPAYNSPLQLIWERSAIYNMDSNTTHAEQMIYNYDVNNLPSTFLTSNRTGKLEYAYFDRENSKDKSTWRIIYRNVIDKNTNYLKNEAINTEYTFGPLTTLTGNPYVPGGWGNLESYRWNN